MSATKTPLPFSPECHPASEEIRDAACIVVIDGARSDPALLMGRRHASQVFLPDKWVFPGGRVDDGDRRIAAGFPLDYAPADLAAEIRPFAVAAVRELEEETGIVIGEWGAQGDFAAFCAANRCSGRRFPHTARLSPLARAITPPGRVRRYDTWFFTADAAAAHAVRGAQDGELLDLEWFTLERARRLDLPNITRLILDDVAQLLSGANEHFVPFYSPDSGGFRRTYASCRKVAPTP